MVTIHSGSSEKKMTTRDDEYNIALPRLSKNTVLNQIIIQPFTNIKHIKIDDVPFSLENGTANIDKINYTRLTLVYNEKYLNTCDWQMWCQGSHDEYIIETQECLWNSQYTLEKKYKRYFVIIPSISANFYIEKNI